MHNVVAILHGEVPSPGQAEDDQMSTAVRWFDRALAAFCAAEQSAGPTERHYAIGAHIIGLRFAGPALVQPMTSALAHRATDQTREPDFTICLYDGSCGLLPRPTWGPESYGARGEIRGFNVGPIRTVFDAGDQILRMADLSRRIGLFWISDASDVPYYERGAPLRTLLHWLLGDRQCQLVHAAAVGTRQGSVLLAGKGGSGKSTSALSCVGSPLRYLGDDYVMVSVGSPPRVFSLYNSAKLHGEQMNWFPRWRDCVDNASKLETEKALVFLERHAPETLGDGFPLKAILLPKVTGRRDTRIAPASPAQALAALAPTTVFQLPGDGSRAFATLTSLVRFVPSYWLEAGTELQRIPEAIVEVIGP